MTLPRKSLSGNSAESLRFRGAFAKVLEVSTNELVKGGVE